MRALSAEIRSFHVPATRAFIGLCMLACINISAQAQQSTTGPIPPPDLDPGLILARATAVTIPGVPAYLWHHGCGPTAVGMVVGYWDASFANLVPGDAASQTAAVDAMIADDSGFPLCSGPASDHFQDYSCPKDYSPNPLQTDRSETGGAHADNCVGDFMYTSQSAYWNYYGWSWFSHVPQSFTGYVALSDPSLLVTSANHDYSGFGWTEYKSEIDQGRPVVLLVDTDGDNSTDHFITGVGYDEASLTYIAYNTWDRSLHSYLWRGMAPGNTWGIYGVTTFLVSDPNAPIISVAPANCDFGTVPVGGCSSPNEILVVENIGGGTLTGNATVPLPFGIVAGGSYALPPGEAQEVTISFCPIDTGSFNNSVTFTGGGGADVPVTGRGCGCPYQCDYDQDLFLTAVDLGQLIAVLFEGNPPVQDPGCPTVRGDFDCDGFPTAVDLGGLIAHLFEGGPGPCDPCDA